MKRRLLNLLTLLSLVLFVAVAAVGVGSYWAEMWVGYGHVPSGRRPVDIAGVTLAAGKGNAWVGVESYRDVYDLNDTSLFFTPGWRWGLDEPVDVARRGEESFLGFAWHDMVPGDGIRYRGVAFPLWLAALLFLLLPAVRTHRFVRRRRRRRAGRCPACGYDLRATPGQCPECGEAAVTG